MEVVFDKLSIKVCSKSVTGQLLSSSVLLHPLSSSIPSGSMCCILGGSGSGKTTLLSVIGNRYDTANLSVDGSVDFRENNVRVANHTNCNSVGYVTQHDYLLPFLTARETLMYAALLLCPNPMPTSSCSCKSGTNAVESRTRMELCHERVDNLILKLGLKECADNVFIGGTGTSQTRGLSGGEKRRVSVGIQMLTNPGVLCADEPTSGLDSFTALTVVEALRDLAVPGEGGMTVVCSIHQPRADIFAMFDHILLLSGGGQLIYSSSIAAGTMNEDTAPPSCGQGHTAGLRMMSHFGGLGFNCPGGSNPADYYVDISSVDTRAAAAAGSGGGTEQADRARVKRLAEACKSALEAWECGGGGTIARATNALAGPTASTGSVATAATPPTLWQQITVLFSRNLRNSIRDWSNTVGCLLQCIVMALVVVGLFYRLADDESAAIRSRPGMIYTLLASEPYILTIILVDRYTTELKIFDRELQDKMYSSGAYFIAYIASTYPFLILQSVLAATIVYFGCNMRGASGSSGAGGYDPGNSNENIFMYGTLNSPVERFESYVTVVLAVCSAAVYISGLALLGASLTRTFSIASLFCNAAFTFICLTSGFLIITSSLPIYVKWITHISFFHYAFNIVFANEMEGRIFPGCPDAAAAGGSPDVHLLCSEYSGDAVMGQFDIKPLREVESFVDHPWFGLICLILGCHIVSAVLLEAVRYSPSHSVGGYAERPSGEELRAAAADAQAEKVSADGSCDIPTPQKGTCSTSETFHRIEISVRNVFISVTRPLAPEEGDTGASDEMPRNEGETSGDIEMSLPATANITSTSYSPESQPMSPLRNDIVPDVPRPHSEQVIAGADSYQKVILSNISCTIYPGKLTALMGGSGSGKTTLLSTIVGRISAINTNPISEVSGKPVGAEYTYNMSGSVVCVNSTRTLASSVDGGSGRLVGFVPQFDYHLANLTVVESLLFHAQMKCRSMSDEQKQKRILELVQLLGLQACMHTRIGCDSVDMSGASGAGATSKKGISGGEKRRLSVGIQMLLDPPVCVLDEPTTGLDTFSARHIIETLHSIAHTRQRTMLVSIHQPRYDVYAHFDSVILLSRGRIIWSGDPSEMMNHFAARGYCCPPHCNPADFILDTTSIDCRSAELEAASRARLQTLIQSYRAHCDSGSEVGVSSSGCSEVDTVSGIRVEALTNTAGYAAVPSSGDVGSADGGGSGFIGATLWALHGVRRIAEAMLSVASEPFHHPLVYSLPLLLHRSYLNLIREPEAMVGRCSQGLFLGAIVVLFYAPIAHTQVSVQNRIGCIFFISSICFIGVLNCIAMYPTERNVFYREYLDDSGGADMAVEVEERGAADDENNLVRSSEAETVVGSSISSAQRGYSPKAFFLCYFLLSVPFIAIAAVGVGVFLGVFVGLNHSTEGVITLIYVVFLELLIGECIGVAFCSFFFHIGFSVNTMSAFLSALCLGSGLVSLHMSGLFNALNYLSPFKYAAWVSINVAFKNQQFDCAPNAWVNGTCVAGFTDGNQVLEAFNMTDAQEGDMTAHLWVLTALSACFVAMAYLAVLFRVGTLKAL